MACGSDTRHQTVPAGQVVLALILSLAQIVVFTLLGIPYGVLFAVAIGFTTLIPYASALTIVLVSLLLGLGQGNTLLFMVLCASASSPHSFAPSMRRPACSTTRCAGPWRAASSTCCCGAQSSTPK